MMYLLYDKGIETGFNSYKEAMLAFKKASSEAELYALHAFTKEYYLFKTKG